MERLLSVFQRVLDVVETFLDGQISKRNLFVAQSFGVVNVLLPVRLDQGRFIVLDSRSKMLSLLKPLADVAMPVENLNVRVRGGLYGELFGGCLAH